MYVYTHNINSPSTGLVYDDTLNPAIITVERRYMYTVRIYVWRQYN